MISNNEIKTCGIRKDRVWLIPATLTCAISVIIAVIVSWWFYSDEFDYEYLLENGVEVEATVVDYDYHSESYSDGDSNYLSGWYYIWECYNNGRRYWGTAPNGYLRTEEEVLQYLGEKFTVTVDPNSSWVVDKSKAEILADGFHYTEYLTCAIVFTCLLPLVMFVSVKFAFYPIILDSKIDRSGKLPTEGEVIKVRNFVVSYIKVRYFDNTGTIKEKWSYAWFTKREAKYLQQKKTINIVPYKNTYGILEEMSLAKR